MTISQRKKPDYSAKHKILHSEEKGISMEWEKLLCPDRIRSIRGSGTPGDLRTEFEKDYHRIVGSASFRRLQDKTQVFPLDRSDFVRTRLTHSLEVSSFAKSLGQNISQKIITQVRDPSFEYWYQADVCDILQCAGLLHDIGNPPFGHFGETAIQEWFKKNLPQLTYEGKSVEELLTEQMKADFYHFEGNTQAFRLVTKLHFLVDEHGMNLTKGLLGTMIKYPVSSLQIDPGRGDIKYKKMGYFYADKEIFEEVESSTGTEGLRHPLAFVLEAADDIAYKTADIEDAFKKGCISYDQLLRELDKTPLHDGLEAEEYRKLVGLLRKRYDTAVERAVDRPDIYAVQNWVVSLQGRLLTSATYGFIENYDAILRGTYQKDLFAGTAAERIMEVLGDVAYRYAFISKPILKLELAAETVFDFLLGMFVDAVLYYDTSRRLSEVQKKVIALISDNYKRIYHIYSKDKDEAGRLYLRLLLVTDYVCGMTDSYAKSLYQELNGIV